MSNNTELQTALRSSHRRLEEATRPLTDGEIAGPSYCTDWSTAQVLSHIGSGAQVFGLLLDAGLAGAEQPGREEFSRIWDVWPPAAATVRMPASALVRLVYGRLDAEHTPATVEADGVDLETLRSIFPGF